MMKTLYFNQMDYQNASYWALEGAAVNDAWCLHLLGTIARDQRNFREAEQWYSRDNWLINQSDGKALIDEYYSIAPTIVKKINNLNNAGQIYKSIWNEYLKPCLEFIEIGDNKKCKQLYMDMVTTLKKRFVD